MKSLIFVTLMVAVCVSSSSALRCYQCVFPGNDKCQNPSELTSETCGELGNIESLGGVLKPACLKSVVDVGGVKQITRSCSKMGGSYSACSLIKDNIEHCSVCESDDCNGSSHMMINIWTTLIPVFIAFFMKFF